MKKRILSYALSMALFLAMASTLALPASAAASATLSVADVTAYPGCTAVVDVSLRGVTAAIQIAINYDPAALSPESIEIGPECSGWMVVPSDDLTMGRLLAVVSGGKNQAIDGVIARYTYKVNQNAALGKSSLNVSMAKMSDDGASFTADVLNNGSVTVVSSAGIVVTGVTVAPAAVEVRKGDSFDFEAQVAAVGGAADSVSWSVSSALSSISSSGRLSVANDETASTLTVTATSTIDSSKSGTAAVTVLAADAKSSNANLSSLSIGYPLSPAFAPGTTSYSAIVPINLSNVAVAATTVSPGANVVIIGNNPLASTITVTVTAEDGVSVKAYTIEITRSGDSGKVNVGGGSGGSGVANVLPTPTAGPDQETPLEPDDALPETMEDGNAPNAAANLPFTDVDKDEDWFYDDVRYMWEHGLMAGTAATLFSPDMALTRSMVVTVVHRMEGEPSVAGLDNPFNDVAAGQYYTEAVAWAADKGIVLGYGDGTFLPDQNVTREDFSAILYRYEQYAEKIPPNTVEERMFADENDISDYAKEPVKALVMQGIVNGKPNNLFDPKGFATRAEFAAMLHRYLVAIEK